MSHHLKTLPFFLSAALIALALAPTRSWAGEQSSATPVTVAQPQPVSAPDIPSTPTTLPDVSDTPIVLPLLTIVQGTDSARPVAVSWALSEQAQKSVEAAKTTRAEFLKHQQETESGLHKAKEEVRTRLREDLQKAREDFLATQRQSRDDLKKQLAALKDQLQQHREMIDEAKGETKERVRARKEE